MPPACLPLESNPSIRLHPRKDPLWCKQFVDPEHKICKLCPVIPWLCEKSIQPVSSLQVIQTQFTLPKIIPTNLCVSLLHMYRQMQMTTPSRHLHLVYGKAKDLQKVAGKSSILDWE